MSKGNSNKSNTQQKAPEQPPPQNEYYYENDFLRSSRIFDKSKNAYVNKAFSNPTEQALENNATNYMGKLVNDLPNAVNLSPEAIASYGEAYAAPQIRALNDSYNRASGSARSAAVASGMYNSAGAGDYFANEIEKNRAQGLADIAANRKLMELDLPNKLLTPYVNQFNLYNAALQGQQASMAQDFEPSMSGNSLSNQIAQNQYTNSFNAWQARQSMNQQPQKRGGLFSFFSGGS